MIRAIGYKLSITLLLLAVMLAFLVYYSIYLVGPDTIKAERQLASHKSEMTEITEKIAELKDSMDKFNEQKVIFEKVAAFGFFDEQNRPETRQRLNAMQQESRLLSAKYRIDRAETEKNDLAREAGYKILNTKINFTLEAIEDADIYRFIYLLNYGFPGQVVIDRLTISRDIDITLPVLKQIGNQENITLVTADLTISGVQWWPMKPSLSKKFRKRRFIKCVFSTLHYLCLFY